MNTNKRWLIWLLIIAITIIWGYSWTLMKASLNFMGPFTFSALRFLVGSITMLIIVWFLRVGKPAKKYMKHLIIVGLLQTSVVFILVMYGLLFVDAGKSSVLLYSMPIWSTILAYIILKEKVSFTRVIGLILGIIGLLTILGWDIWINQNTKVLFGEFLIVLAAISWGGSNIYYRVKLKELSLIQVNTYQMVFGTIAIILVAFIMEGGEPVQINLTSIYYVLFTGVLASALCFSVWFYLLKIIDMATATISTLLVPVFGLFFGWLILNESLTLTILVGSMFILIGIMVTTIQKKKTKSHMTQNTPGS